MKRGVIAERVLLSFVEAKKWKRSFKPTGLSGKEGEK
jgi:hypothetical protein